MCVCVLVWEIRVCGFKGVWVCMGMHVCVYAWMRVRVYVCVCVCMYICMCFWEVGGGAAFLLRRLGYLCMCMCV